MTRVFGHYVSLDMVLLFGLELCLTFLLFRAMAGLAGPVAGLDELEPVAFAMVMTLTVGSLATAIGLYRPEAMLERRRLLINAAVTAILAFPAAVALFALLSLTMNNAAMLGLARLLLVWTAGLLVLRSVVRAGLGNKVQRPVLVVGDGRRAQATAALVGAPSARFYTLLGTIPSIAGGLSPWDRSRIWAMVVAGTPAEIADAAARSPRGVRVYDDCAFWEQRLGRMNLDALPVQQDVVPAHVQSSRGADAVRRVMDIAFSVTLLLFTLPLMLIVALLIKLDSRGPVFYSQERVGLGGRGFTLTKFRSMRTDAESGGARWATKNDPRITRVGAFIRLTRIDELPQLITVLRGEMSFVGPRPERPHFTDELARVIPHYAERARVKPGITGWAQVNYPYGASIEDARQKLSYDLYYIKHRSLFLDILILISTVRVILFQEGAR